MEIDMPGRSTAALWALLGLLVLPLEFAAAHQKGTVAFNEARHGDIPGAVRVPEDWETVYLFELVPGKNLVKGSMPISVNDDFFDIDEDPFRIVIPDGYECTKIRLLYRWNADPSFKFFVYRLNLIEEATLSYYQDDEIIFSADPESGPDADRSPVRLFHRVEEIEGTIPPLDEFPEDGLILGAGVWDVDPRWATLGQTGSITNATLHYTLEFVLTPLDTPPTVDSLLEGLMDDVRALDTKRMVRALLSAPLKIGERANAQGNTRLARASLTGFMQLVKQLRGRYVSEQVADHLLAKTRAIFPLL